jgi:DNA-directed RNA polymerase specialized sigma24 family protein
MPKQKRRRSKQVANAAEIERVIRNQPMTVPGEAPFPEQALDGSKSTLAVLEVLKALTELPSDRAKARVLRFVQDYFDERHGH